MYIEYIVYSTTGSSTIYAWFDFVLDTSVPSKIKNQPERTTILPVVLIFWEGTLHVCFSTSTTREITHQFNVTNSICGCGMNWWVGNLEVASHTSVINVGTDSCMLRLQNHIPQSKYTTRKTVDVSVRNIWSRQYI